MFQAEVWEDLRREVVAEDPDPKKFDLYEQPPEPGYKLPKAYIDRTASWLQRFGVLPERGGLNDQPLAWVEDMEKRFAMKNYVAKDYYKSKPSNDQP